MPKCTNEIKKFMASLAPGELFSTTQFLARNSNSHSRASVDSALAKLVKSGILDRITSGVFVVSEKRKATYTNLEIAGMKARASANQIHCLNLEKQLDENDDTSLDKNSKFFALGNNTRFLYQGKYIYIKKLSAKKLQLTGSEVGAIALCLWLNGKHITSADEIARAVAPLCRKDLEEFIAFAPYMPSWLSARAKEAIGPKWQKIEKELQQRNPAKNH